MGAGPWELYNSVRRRLMDGSIDVDGNTFNISLFTNASNANDPSMVVISDLHGEVANQNGYVAGGKALVNVVWGVADTPDEMRWTANSTTWAATGSGIANV